MDASAVRQLNWQQEGTACLDLVIELSNLCRVG